MSQACHLGPVDTKRGDLFSLYSPLSSLSSESRSLVHKACNKIQRSHIAPVIFFFSWPPPHAACSTDAFRNSPVAMFASLALGIGFQLHGGLVLHSWSVSGWDCPTDGSLKHSVTLITQEGRAWVGWTAWYPVQLNWWRLLPLPAFVQVLPHVPLITAITLTQATTRSS